MHTAVEALAREFCWSTGHDNSLDFGTVSALHPHASYTWNH